MLSFLAKVIDGSSYRSFLQFLCLVTGQVIHFGDHETQQLRHAAGQFRKLYESLTENGFTCTKVGAALHMRLPVPKSVALKVVPVMKMRSLKQMQLFCQKLF